MWVNGAEIIIRQLERQGIRIVTGIPGGANLPLYDALAASTTIRREPGARGCCSTYCWRWYCHH